MRLRSLLIPLVSFIASVGSLAAQPKPLSLPTNGVLADQAWDIRLGMLPVEKRFAVITRAYQKSPSDPSIKAHYAEYLVGGKNWGGPEGRAAEGVALATEAADAGNICASRVIGLAQVFGLGTPTKTRQGSYLLEAAAQDGDVKAMIMVGQAGLHETELDQTVSLAEAWFRQAAKRGYPEPLYKLGLTYEKNRDGKVISIPKAAGLLYEAARYGYYPAYTRMKQVLKQQDAAPEMRRAACLTLLWYGALGENSLQTSRVGSAALELETHYPEDAEALAALGHMYCSGEFDMRDMKKAFAFFTKAAALGSDDARCERANMQAEGMGVPADPVAALAVWRELEKKLHPGALASLGYYSYWGSLKGAGLPKDENKAYGYSRMAAAAGDLFGQHNATLCFSHGIGTEKNYLLTIAYCQAAALRGSKPAQKELPKLVSAAFD